jgi:hypothetical protein
MEPVPSREPNEPETASSPPAPDPAPDAPWPVLSAAERVALAPVAPPAPTTPPRAPILRSESVDRGLRSALRRREERLGLGGPERREVTEAIRTALFRAPVPGGSHVRYEVRLDARGIVASVRRLETRSGDETLWRGVDRAVTASLTSRPIPLGSDARIDGVRIVVDAEVVHVLAQGSLDGTAIGECPAFGDGGEVHGESREFYFPSARFFAVGGPALGEAPPSCLLREVNDGHRHIEVRATTASFFEDEPPPPAEIGPRIRAPWSAPELAGPFAVLRVAATAFLALDVAEAPPPPVVRRVGVAARD